MKQKPSQPSKTSPWLLVGALGLAALGQAFLIHQEIPWTAWVGLAFYAASLYLFLKGIGPAKKEKPLTLPFRTEVLLLSGIFLIAAFFRFFRLSQFPAGIFPDDACAALGTLQILHEGWRPLVEILGRHSAAPSLYYELAGWFLLAPETRLGLFSFSAFLSLLTLGFVYAAFRKLAGVPAALLAAFLFAVMRWDVTFSRNAHLNIDVPFYLAGALCFWLYSFAPRKPWAPLLWAVFLAGGLYAYTSYMVFLPLMVLWIAYEIRQNRFPKAELAVPGLVFLLLGLPFLYAVIQSPYHGSFLGAPHDRHLSSFLRAMAHGDFSQLPGNLAATFFMFNRHGDPWYPDNLPGHRILDDGTAVLWLLGLALGLARIRERKFFYAVTGFAAMCLPTFLTNEPSHAGRALGAAPFAVLLAALALEALWARARGFGAKLWPAWVLALCLLGIAAQNFFTYFGEQAQNAECWRGPGADATSVGETVAQSPPGEAVYVASRFYQHYAVSFLAFSKRKDIRLFTGPENLGPWTGGQGALFALDEGKTGVLAMLQDLFPGGKTWKTLDPWGVPLAYFYEVSPPITAGTNKGYGLKALYYLSLEAKGVPAFSGIAPVLNFTFRDDFPVQNFPPLAAVFSGYLKAPEKGDYHFLVLATDPATLKIDGNRVLAGANQEPVELKLAAGRHSIEVTFTKAPYLVREEGQATALNLLWQRPDGSKWEIVPWRFLSHGR